MKKENDSIAFKRVPADVCEHLWLANPLSSYITFDQYDISILAAMTGGQLKELFTALKETDMTHYLEMCGNVTKDPLVIALMFNFCDKVKYGKFVVDNVDEV